MKKLLVISFLSLFVCANIHAKNLNFMVSEDISYDDNIYLNNSGKVGSVISSTKLGANYKTQVPETGVEAKLTGIVGYNAFSKDNGKNGYWDALANAEVSNDIVKVGDRFILTSDPANKELTDKAKRLSNDAYAELRTNPEKILGFGLKIQDIYDRYFEHTFEYLNRNRLNLGADIFYNISAKTNVFVEYMYSNIKYQSHDVNDSTGGAFALGINGDISSTINGTAKVSYDYRNYKEHFDDRDNHAGLMGYYLALEWNPTTRNTIRLSGSRGLEETIWGNNRYFIDTGINLYASHKLTDKFTVAASFGYDRLDYKQTSDEGVDRGDNVFTIKPEVSYSFKEWLKAGVWYQYRLRRSNAEATGYNNNKLGAYVKAFF